MHKALDPGDDRQTIYVKKRGRKTVCQDSVDASIQRLEEHIKKLQRKTRNNIDNTGINRTKITRKQSGKKNNCMDISSDKQAKSNKSGGVMVSKFDLQTYTSEFKSH